MGILIFTLIAISVPIILWVAMEYYLERKDDD